MTKTTRPKQPRKPGRPSIYSEALATTICTRLAGGESLRSICRSEGMPDKATILQWVVDGQHKEFSDQYAHAREAAGYAHGDTVIEIVERLLAGGIDPQTAKAAMDGLKWSAERMAPKSHIPRAALEQTQSANTWKPLTLADFYGDSLPDTEPDADPTLCYTPPIN